MQTPRDLPAADVGARRAAPVVSGEAMTGTADASRHFHDCLRGDATLCFGVFGCEAGILDFELFDERFKSLLSGGRLVPQKILPVDPAPHELRIVDRFIPNNEGHR